MKLTLGIPVFDTYEAETTMSLLMAVLGDFPHQVHLGWRKGTYLDTAREEIILEALKVGSEKLVFIDSDMMFPPQALCRLIAHQHTIVGAAYNQKKVDGQGRSISTVKISDGNGGYATGAAIPDKPFMCAAVGTGFLAIHLPTLVTRMEPPYFEYDRTSKGRYGEDTYFCEKARASGIEVWCDPTIPLRHMGSHAY